jgi:ABC-2 type transport system ATP-binding protein
MITVSNLSKYYGGKRALGPVTFEIKDGETVGFLGLNGAGKTTALRILACDLMPSTGTVRVGDIDAISDPHEVKKQIGFVPENPPVYADMRVFDYLRFAGELRGMNSAEIKRRAPEVIDATHLGEVIDDPIANLSHGFRQRVGLAQAIIHNPKFLILDEPTRGLDPVQIVEMRNLINNLKQDHTVLISSHILSEISQTCDHVLVLNKGAIVGAGTEAELAKAASGTAQVTQVTVVVRLPGDSSVVRAAEVLAAVPGVSSVGEAQPQGDGFSFTVSTDGDVRAQVSRAVVGAGFDLLKLDYVTGELEEIFIRLVGGSHARN